MKWTKRLKWIRLSKIVIPIALAVTLLFAGFTVYANKAENFVIRIDNSNDVNLSLTLNRDLTNQTERLSVPLYDEATKTPYRYMDATYEPDKNLLFNKKDFVRNLPDDIAKQDGIHPVFYPAEHLETNEKVIPVSFYSFSFWLVNNSKRAVDVGIRLKIDEITHGTSNSTVNMSDAVRVMFIEGEPLLSDETYRIYKKADRTYDETTEEGLKKAEEDREQLSNIKYGNVTEFKSDICIFERLGVLGLPQFPSGAAQRFTMVIWLEGNDPECTDLIRKDSLKMSLDFFESEE